MASELLELPLSVSVVGEGRLWDPVCLCIRLPGWISVKLQIRVCPELMENVNFRVSVLISELC